MKALALIVLLAMGLLVVAGCTKTEVSESDINALGKEHNQQSYEDAMKKAGREKDLEAEKKMAAERGQGDSGR